MEDRSALRQKIAVSEISMPLALIQVSCFDWAGHWPATNTKLLNGVWRKGPTESDFGTSCFNHGPISKGGLHLAKAKSDHVSVGATWKRKSLNRAGQPQLQ